LSRDDCGTRRTLPSGEDITIALPSTAGTGYSQNLDNTDDFQEIRVATVAASGVPGAPGTRIFRVVPLRSGQLGPRFVKRRRWSRPPSRNAPSISMLRDPVDPNIAGAGQYQSMHPWISPAFPLPTMGWPARRIQN